MQWSTIFAAVSLALVVGTLADREPFRHHKEGVSNRIVGYRLPRTLLPDHYDIHLLPFLIEGNFTFDGYVKITFTCYEATDSITLHQKDMTVEKPEVRGESDDETFDVVGVTEFNADTEQVVITVDRVFTIGKSYSVSMKFVGILNDKLAGFYRSSYVNAEGVRKYQAVTQFESTDARRAFPSFDEPNMKSFFTVKLGRTRDYSTLANGIIAQQGVEHETDNNYVWDIYETTPVKMSTYLVAFAVTDFVKFEGRQTSSGTPVAHYANPTYTADQAALGLEVTPVIMEFFEAFTGIPFAMPKMDQVAVTEFDAGAMENWGLIKYRESLLIWDGPLKHPASAEQSVVSVIAHELAHQWFGNLVTCDWWSIIWLNEGFATFMEYQGAGAARPNWPKDQLFLVDTVQYVMGGPDSLESTRPMYVPVESNDQLGVFDSIAYEKSGSVIRMVQDFLGAEVFQKGLQLYLNTKKFENAQMIDLFDAWQAEAVAGGVDLLGVDILEIMDTWTLQKNFPLVTVTRDYANNKASIVQKRFLRTPYPKKAEAYLWWIPLTYTQDFIATPQRSWYPATVNPVEVEIADSSKAVFFNIEGKGYYRVNYDEQNWRLISEKLTNNPSSIGVMNRAQIIDDALNLAKEGFVSYNTALEVTRFLKNEVEWLPWETFDNDIVFLDNLLASRLAYGDFKIYVSRLITKVYNDVTFQDNIEDDIITLYKRIVAVRWACKFGLTDCVDNAESLYAKWVAAGGLDSSFISPNQKSAVLCNAIRHGGQDEFNFAVNVYANEVNSPDRAALLTALTCTRDSILVNRLLEWSITNSSIIPKTSAPSVYTNLANNPTGRNQAFLFLRDNWDAAKTYFGQSNTGANGIAAVSRYFSQSSEVTELINFRDAHNDDGVVVATLAPSIERAEANLVWASTYYQDIADWLTNEVISGK